MRDVAIDMRTTLKKACEACKEMGIEVSPEQSLPQQADAILEQLSE